LQAINPSIIKKAGNPWLSRINQKNASESTKFFLNKQMKMTNMNKKIEII
jgi:hypothetical protein